MQKYTLSGFLEYHSVGRTIVAISECTVVTKWWRQRLMKYE